jgi:hypothetical protein
MRVVCAGQRTFPQIGTELSLAWSMVKGSQVQILSARPHGRSPEHPGQRPHSCPRPSALHDAQGRLRRTTSGPLPTRRRMGSETQTIGAS